MSVSMWSSGVLSAKINLHNMEVSIMAKQVFEPRTDETVFARKVSADCWKSPKQALSRQIAGKTYFTDQRIAFLASGLIGTESVSWEIEMKDIQSVKACLTPPFFPFGVLITMKDGSQYKLGILGRNKYVEWIAQHIS